MFHCVGGKDRTGLLALVLLTLAGAAPDGIIADYLLTYDRMKQRYDELGLPDQLTAVTALLASYGTTIEASLASTIASLTMPGHLLRNGLTDTEFTALHARLTTWNPGAGNAEPVPQRVLYVRMGNLIATT